MPCSPTNPAYGLISNFRVLVLGGDLDCYSLSVSLFVAVPLFLPAPFTSAGWNADSQTSFDRGTYEPNPSRRHWRGYRGPNLIRNFVNCPLTEVAAVCDRVSPAVGGDRPLSSGAHQARGHAR